MRLVEGVVLRLLHVLPELVRDGRRRAAGGAALEELLLEGRHQRVDLLADRLAQVVRLARREARDLLGDVEVLLLVDADASGDRGDLLQPRVDEGHLLLAVLAARVGRDVGHRARAIQGDERDQVLELGRLHLAQGLAHARRLELEDADRVGPGEHLVGLAVVHRDLRDVEPAADELHRLVDHVEVAQAEEVDLQQADRLDIAARELGDDLLVGALLLQRNDVGQRRGRRSRRPQRGSSPGGRGPRAASRGRRSRGRAGSESYACLSSCPGFMQSSR